MGWDISFKIYYDWWRDISFIDMKKLIYYVMLYYKIIYYTIKFISYSKYYYLNFLCFIKIIFI